MTGFEIAGIILLCIVGLALAYVIGHLLMIVIMAAFVNPNKEYERESKFYGKFLNYSVWLALKLANIKVVLTGVEKIPTDSRFLFVSNHRSGYDPVIVRAVLGKYDINFISKPENFKVPILKQFMVRLKFLSIDRDNPRNSLKTIVKAIEYIKNDEGSMGVYPEGTRSKTGELLPFHDGVFKIAIKANVPVVVACLKGQENVKKNVPFKKTIINFDILDVLSVEDKISSHDLAEQARTLIENKLNESK